MKTGYRHIHFVEDECAENVWLCMNNKSKSALGRVLYFKPWKRYIFETLGGRIFDDCCLADIIDFMKQLKT